MTSDIFSTQVFWHHKSQSVNKTVYLGLGLGLGIGLGLRMSVSSNYIPIRRIGIRQNAVEVKLMSSDDKCNSGDVWSCWNIQQSEWQKKVNLPMVSIAVSQLCNLRVGAHLHFTALSRQWAADTAQLCGRYLSLPSRNLDQYQIILLGDRGTWVWTTCPELLLE